jgi:CheY-like chemotaxis protein
MASPESRTWLLVEDDENDVILLRRALQRVDPEAVLYWVQDGTLAIDYLAGRGRFMDRVHYPLPFVVLSDLKMPRCSGLELVKWVRQQPSLRALPFIMFSSSDVPTDVAEAYREGVNWYLAKPTAFETLTEMVSRLSENLATSVWT